MIKALINAYKWPDKPEYFAIKTATYGLMFFGVPNYGLRNEQLRSLVDGQANASLVNDLVLDNDMEPSTYLRRISNDFSRCCKDRYQVVSFYELERSPTVQVRRFDAPEEATADCLDTGAKRNASRNWPGDFDGHAAVCNKCRSQLRS